jgi:hypothetical protein
MKSEHYAPPCDADCKKNGKLIRNHAELSVRLKKELSYPGLLVSNQVAAALMVCYTFHLQTSVPTRIVRLLPLGRAPVANDHCPTLGM